MILENAYRHLLTSVYISVYTPVYIENPHNHAKKPLYIDTIDTLLYIYIYINISKEFFSILTPPPLRAVYTVYIHTNSIEDSTLNIDRRVSRHIENRLKMPVYRVDRRYL